MTKLLTVKKAIYFILPPKKSLSPCIMLSISSIYIFYSFSYILIDSYGSFAYGCFKP